MRSLFPPIWDARRTVGKCRAHRSSFFASTTSTCNARSSPKNAKKCRRNISTNANVCQKAFSTFFGPRYQTKATCFDPKCVRGLTVRIYGIQVVELESGRQHNSSKICVGPLARRADAPAKVDNWTPTLKQKEEYVETALYSGRFTPESQFHTLVVPAKVDLRPLFYWHLQKAGSSFMNLLILSGCYGQFRPFKNPTDFVQYIKGLLETVCPAGFSRFSGLDSTKNWGLSVERL